MDAVRSLALDLAPVAAVLALVLLTWLWSAALHGRHAPAPPGAAPVVPRQRDRGSSAVDAAAGHR